MADAPSGGGTWEPFEIIIVVILLIGLLSRLDTSSDTKKAPTTTKPKAEVVSKAPDPNACGLTLSRPHSLEKPTTVVTLIGSTAGCNWTSTSDVALYAQVVDARGMPVSAYTTVPVASSGVNTAYFDTSISLTDIPAKGTGYLILIPATTDPTHPISVRIPLKF